MTVDLVRQAAVGREFDAEPLPDSLPACHVPFADLVGEDVEGALDERLAAHGRVGLTGPVGSGKSSIVRFVLRQAPAPRFAPVYVNVATEDPDRIGTPRGFLEVLVAQLARAAARAGQIDAAQREELLRDGQTAQPLAGRQRTRHLELGASYWLLSGSLAEDLTTTLPEGQAYASTDDLRDAARDALAAIAAEGHTPVLVADDTDRLLRMPGREVSQRLFEGFFGEVLRMIVDTLEAALVVAVHRNYLDDPQFRYHDLTEGRIEFHLDVPELRHPEQLGDLLSGRAEFLSPGTTWRELLTQEALEELLRAHAALHERSLRKTLVDLRSAFALAVDDEAELVSAQHVRAAVAG